MFSSPEAAVLWSRRRWMVVAAGFCSYAAQQGDLRRISPPSEQPDPALLSLLGRLRKIVAAREHLALEALMGPVFRVEFDVGKGPGAFRRYWRPESAASPVWEILQRMLALPAHRYSNTLCAIPYVFARFPFDLDPLRHVVAVRDGVPLLAQPRSDANRVGSLDYSIIPLVRPLQPPVIMPAGSFLELTHPVVSSCFAATADLWNPAAHRAFFEKRGREWRWISLAAATTEDPPELRRHRPVTG